MRRRTKAAVVVATGVLTLSAGLIGLATTAATADAPPGSGFLSLNLVAESGGERVVFTQAETTQPDGFAEADIPFAQASLSTSNAHALASAAWPGAAAGDFGSFFLLAVDPTGPKKSTILNDPVRAEAPTTTGQTTVTNNTVPGLNMTATATPANVVADALVGGSNQAEIGSYGTTRTTSKAIITGPTTAEADALSVAQDLDLLDGLVTITSVNSHALVTTDGTRSSGTGTTTVSGLKIAGIPATVDQTGVHAVGKGGLATANANKQINKALAQSKTQMFITEPLQTTDVNGTTEDAGALYMSFNDGGNWLVIGGAHAVAGATLGQAFQLPTGGFQPPPALAPPPVTTPNTPTLPTGTTGTPPTASVPLPQTAPQQQPPPALVANPVRLPGGALAPGWLAAVLLGAGLVAFGLWRLPDRLLEQVPTSCPLGESK